MIFANIKAGGPPPSHKPTAVCPFCVQVSGQLSLFEAERQQSKSSKTPRLNEIIQS